MAAISTIPSLAGVIDAKMFCYRRAAFMRLGEDVGKRTVTCYDKWGHFWWRLAGESTWLPARNLIHPSLADQLKSLPLQEPRALFEIDVAWRKGESSATILNFIKNMKAL
jgi:hypothetical protein